jgi:hypothetical protein
MLEQEPTPEPFPTKKFILSALPALGATVFILIHLRGAIVPNTYQSVLMNAWLGLLCATLAYWLYVALCRVADRICDKFDARHDEIVHLLEAHTVASAKDFRTAMAKLAKACKRLEAVEKQNTEMAAEIAHLRQLLVEHTPGSLTGPSPFS